jgi:putative intracellular protease/amidase
MDATLVHTAVYDTFADWEVGLAIAHIANPQWQRQPGRYRVVTVGATREPVTSMGGMRVVPDVVLADLRPSDSAMLVLPGADTWLAGGNRDFAEKAAELLAAGVPVAAICGATAGLAAAGLLDERRHTSNAGEFLAATGYRGSARYCDEPAVTDGDLVTGSGTAPVEFAREVLARLDVYRPEVLASWYKLYGLHDPAGYFELMASAA